jgi:cystathionine beta-lyase/cystathionine gamma-synthase
MTEPLPMVASFTLVDSVFSNFYFSDKPSNAGTKYFGGHSDLLSGVLVVKALDDWTKAGC